MTQATNDLAIVIDSLARCAQKDVDIADLVYERFFELSAKAQLLMESSDQYMRGRMLEQTLEMIMRENNDEDIGYLRWELENHLLAYGVELPMYEHFLNSIAYAVGQALGDQWLRADQQAWSQRIGALLEQIDTESNFVA